MRRVQCNGARLSLRDVTEADVAALHAVYGDRTATQYMPFGPRTNEQVADLVQEALAAATAEPRRLYMLAVVDTDHRDVIGWRACTSRPTTRTAPRSAWGCAPTSGAGAWAPT